MVLKLKRILAGCLCIGCVLGALYLGAKPWIDKEASQSESRRLAQHIDGPANGPPERRTFDWDAILAENPAVVAWLQVPETGIDTCIVQGADDRYYLDHAADGTPSNIGAAFLDANCPPDFSADCSIIFGHSVLYTGGMFTDLKDFCSETFFHQVPAFWIWTPDGDYRCHVMSVYKGEAKDAACYQYDFGSDRKAVLERLEEQALFYRDRLVTDDDHLVTLSTCDLDYGLDSTRRIALTGLLEPVR